MFAQNPKEHTNVSKIMRVQAVQPNPLLASLFAKASKDDMYGDVIQAFHNGNDLKQLHNDHPARELASK